MRDTINRLTVALAFLSGLSIWLVSNNDDGVLAGIAAWVLIATLTGLLTWYSVRIRWFLAGAVRPLRLEDEHEVPILEIERRPSAITEDGRNPAPRKALPPSTSIAERLAVARMLDEGCPNVQPQSRRFVQT